MHLISCQTKMRQLIILSAILSVSFAAGQHTIYPDTFPNVAGFRSVLVKMDDSCSNVAEKNKLIGKYFFDNTGNTIEYVSIWDSKVNGRKIYTYADNQLVSQQNFK